MNLGELAKGILSDAVLKETYAKTMMRTLFMLESAEETTLDLNPSQVRKERLWSCACARACQFAYVCSCVCENMVCVCVYDCSCAYV